MSECEQCKTWVVWCEELQAKVTKMEKEVEAMRKSAKLGQDLMWQGHYWYKVREKVDG